MSLRASFRCFRHFEPGLSYLIPLLAIIVLSLLSFVVFATERLRVGMPLPGQIPFFWQDDAGNYQGIYPDTLRLVAKDLNVDLEFVPLSQARLLKHFVIGEIDIEAGVSPNADDDPALAETSQFTRPFGIVNEVIIYSPALSFPVFILKDLAGRRVATVRGMSAPSYLVREDFSNEWQIAQRVHRGWNEIGLMKEAVALHYQRENNLAYEISLPYASNPVAFRVHRDKSHLLTAMNQSIQSLEQQGHLEVLVCKYLCGTQ